MDSDRPRVSGTRPRWSLSRWDGRDRGVEIAIKDPAAEGRGSDPHFGDEDGLGVGEIIWHRSQLSESQHPSLGAESWREG